MRECSPPKTCHMSHVTCHVSCVTCHISCVTCFFCFFFGQSGEAKRERVCYQRGLPRLVFTKHKYSMPSFHSLFHNVCGVWCLVCIVWCFEHDVWFVATTDLPSPALTASVVPSNWREECGLPSIADPVVQRVSPRPYPYPRPYPRPLPHSSQPQPQ